MKSDLSKVKVGDKIWTIQSGWVIVKSTVYYPSHPIFTDTECSYTIDGKQRCEDNAPSAFTEYPFKEQPIEKDTLVWFRDNESACWKVGYYSHYEDGQHWCFDSSKKSTETEELTTWEIVKTENPLI